MPYDSFDVAALMLNAQAYDLNDCLGVKCIGIGGQEIGCGSARFF